MSGAYRDVEAVNRRLDRNSAHEHAPAQMQLRARCAQLGVPAMTVPHALKQSEDAGCSDPL
jgi:hypothetical protein